MTLKYIPRGIIKQASNHSKTHKAERNLLLTELVK